MIFFGVGFFLQQSGVLSSSFSWMWACCCFFLAQQQVRVALLSTEQPQMAQSPEHSPVKAWAAVLECMANDVSGLNKVIR